MEEELCQWEQERLGREIDAAAQPTSAKLVSTKEMA